MSHCVCDVSVNVCVRAHTDVTSKQSVTVFPWQWLEP